MLTAGTPSTTKGGTQSLAAAAPPAMRRAAEEFEAVFVAQLLKGVTAGLAGPGELGDENDPFASMLQDEYAKLISRKGGIGIGEAVLRQLLQAQEVP